jgi:RNA polymerase sigma-70 factor (ECF subfamily)
MGKAARGDAAACRELVDRHLARILAFAARTLGDPTEAEDVAQETFERMWSHAAHWEAGRGRLTTWLHRIALNLCLDRLRKRREHPADDTEEAPDPAPAAADLLAAKEIASHVRSALARLTDQQRIAVTLCHYQGLRNAEAAEVMDLSVEAVESLLVRGRRSLRSQLKHIAPHLLQEG